MWVTVTATDPLRKFGPWSHELLEGYLIFSY